jgi:hypothetical protein
MVFFKDESRLQDLIRTIAVYRLALGQPRQEDFISSFLAKFDDQKAQEIYDKLVLNLCPLDH